MNLLLDTNIIIWFANGDTTLNEKIQQAICAYENEKFCSIISLWEIAIKINIGKLDFLLPFPQLENLLLENNIRIIYPTLTDLSFYKTMPLYHKDPFDRLLIAQAIVKNLTIITSDKIFSDYPVSIMQQ
jgi:PIN domain nuclease of toxin-antitoxin system